MADDFVQQIARLLDQAPEETERTLHALADSIRDEVESTGAAEIEGLGVFRREGEDLTFEPAPSLERAVNHRYAGLRPLDSGPAEPEAEPPEAEAPEAEAPEAGKAEEPEPDEPADPFADSPLAPLDLSPEPSATDEPEAVEPEPADAFAEPEATELPPTEAPDEPDAETIGPEAIEPEPVPDEPEPSEPDDFEDGLQGEMIGEDAYLDEDDLSDEDGLPDDAPEADDAEVDALLEGVWTPATGATDASHPLGPAPPEMMEEADFSVVGEGEDPEPADEPVASDDLEPDASEPPPTEPEATDEAEPIEPEPPAGAPTPAPGFAATAASAAADTPPRRSRPPRERRSRAPLFGVIAALVFGTLALLWFLNREPAVPPLDERSAPLTADTAETAPPPVGPEAVGDTAAVAEVEPAEPEPEEPEEAEPPSADPLRSSAGIDPAEGGFAWVVASELSREPAERRVAELREQGFRAGVVVEEAAGSTRYRVALGQFATTDEAEQFRSNLPAGVPDDTWLLRL